MARNPDTDQLLWVSDQSCAVGISAEQITNNRMNETKPQNRISDAQWASVRSQVIAFRDKQSALGSSDSKWTAGILDYTLSMANSPACITSTGGQAARRVLLEMAGIKLPVEPEPKVQIEVTVGDGKYTVIQREGEGLRVLRYGDPWLDCTGDGLIYQLAAEVASLRGSLEDIKQSGSDRDIAMEYGHRECFVHAVTRRGFPSDHPATSVETHSMYSNRSRAKEVLDQLNQHRQDNNPYKVQTWLVNK